MVREARDGQGWPSAPGWDIRESGRRPQVVKHPPELVGADVAGAELAGQDVAGADVTGFGG